VRVRGEVAGAPHGLELVAIERLDECGLHELEPLVLDLREPQELARWQGVWVEAQGDWALLDASAAGPNGGVLANPSGRLYASGHALGDARPSAPWRVAPVTSSDEARPAPRLDAHLESITGVLATGPERILYTPEPIAWRARIPPAPPRPQASNLRVVALNLDNYFIALGGQGARSPEELASQRAKLAAALLALDADVLALTELENRGTESLEHLLAGLEPSLSPELRYAFSASSPRDGATLRAAIAYRPARVSPRGEAWFDERPGFRRAPLFQSFARGNTRFTLGVVHFTSKRCDGSPTVVSIEGCGELARRREAGLLVEATQAFEAGEAPEPLLVTGDFNSDALETPLRTLEAAGFVDLLARLPATERYSYVFEGRASLLDHALALNGMSELAERASIWHINADEPLAHDPPGAFASDGAGADPRGSSDHDPIVVDLRP
jgi:predicted extracellular nuclease